MQELKSLPVNVESMADRYIQMYLKEDGKYVGFCMIEADFRAYKLKRYDFREKALKSAIDQLRGHYREAERRSGKDSSIEDARNVLKSCAKGKCEVEFSDWDTTELIEGCRMPMDALRDKSLNIINTCIVLKKSDLR